MKIQTTLFIGMICIPLILQAQTSEAYLTDQDNFCLSSNTFQGTWELIGPKSYISQDLGRIDVVWVDPDDAEHILAGSLSGGLFEKTPGNNWVCKTNKLPGIGVHDIAVYNDGGQTTIVIATSTNDKRYNYGFGLFYSTDEGNTWTFDQAFYDSVSSANRADKLPSVRKAKFIPGTDGMVALVTSSGKVLKKLTFTSSWIDITPTGIPSNIVLHDLEFMPGNSSVFWIAGETVPTAYYTTNGGTTYTNVTSDLTTPGYVNISVPTATDAFVYYTTGATTANVVHYTFANNNYTCQDCNNPAHPGNHGSVFEVSSSDSRVMYFGGRSNTQLFKSVNSGENTFGISDGGHVDCRFLTIYSSTYNQLNPGSEDVVFIGNDGGISNTLNGGTSWNNLNDTGLGVSEFYGLSGVEEFPEVLFGGTQDNQNWRFDNGIPTQFQTGLDGYETESYVNNQGEIVLFYQAGTGVGGPAATDVYRRIEPAGSGTNVTPAITGLEEYSKPAHKQPGGKFYLGMDDLYISINDDPANANDYQKQGLDGSNYNDEEDAVSAIEISPMDAERIYVAYWGAGNFGGSQHFKNQLFYKPGIGNQWVNRTPGFGTACSGCDPGPNSCSPYYPTCFNSITGIVTDPEDYERVWICYRGFDYAPDGKLSSEKKNGVMYSEDAGVTWHHMNTGLPNFPINCIRYQQGTDDILYVGTDAGVFRWVHASGQAGYMGSWECFSNGLPACMVRDIEINYCAEKIRIATLGHGLWQSKLYPQTLVKPRIQTTATWNNDRTETQSMTIPQSQTLTIQNCTVNMAANTYIKVEPGGTLILDGATLTNPCGYMWSGIQVVGNAALKQTPTSNQGLLILKNGAVIENAYVGAMADEANYSAPDYTFPNGSGNKGGGIIQVQFNQGNSCHIVNCRNGIGFGPYHSPPVNGTEPVNKSYIRGCVFENTGELYPPYDNGYTNQHLSMWNVHGIALRCNTFSGPECVK